MVSCNLLFPYKFMSCFQTREGKDILVSDSFQLPSAQNNLQGNVEYLGVAFSALLRYLATWYFKVYQNLGLYLELFSILIYYSILNIVNVFSSKVYPSFQISFMKENILSLLDGPKHYLCLTSDQFKLIEDLCTPQSQKLRT